MLVSREPPEVTESLQSALSCVCRCGTFGRLHCAFLIEQQNLKITPECISQARSWLLPGGNSCLIFLAVYR